MKKIKLPAILIFSISCIVSHAQVTDLQISNQTLSAGDYSARDEVHVIPATNSLSASGPVHLYVDPSIVLNHNFSGITSDPFQSISRSLDENLPVGSTPGKFQTFANGALSYSIPISLPPGTNALMPHLSVEYNSFSEAGIAGLGWSLSGISGIGRAGKTLFHNGAVEGIRFTNDNDCFILNGSRLIPLSGVNGAAGTSYATESESYQEIESFGILGTGPEYFTVKTRDGIMLQFGNSPDSRLVPAGRILNGQLDPTPLAYMLNRVSDLSGNYMTYEYKVLDGEIGISRIQYTGNVLAPFEPYNTVDFHYDSRSDISNSFISDANTAFVNGGSVSSSLMLREIVVMCEGQFSKKYKFNYSFSGVNSYLTGVEEYGSDNTKFNDLLFSYDNDEPGPAETMTNLDAGSGCGVGYYTKYIPVDFNQDGAKDLIALCGQLTNGSTMDWQQWDVLRNNGNGNFVKVNSTGFSFPPDFFSADYYPLNKRSAGNMTIEYIDINGDGLEDLLFATMNPMGGTVKIYPYLSLGENGFDGSVIPSPLVSPALGYAGNTSMVRYLDFNGNGKMDAFVCHQNSSQQAIFTRIWLDIGSGSVPFNFSYMLDFASSFQIDEEGDGKSELTNIIHNTGNHLDQYVLKFDGTDFQFVHDLNDFSYPGFVDFNLSTDPNCIMGIFYDLIGDFNGDRISDVLEASDASAGLTWTIKYGMGNGQHLLVDGGANGLTLSNPFNTCNKFYFARDINSDGKTDVLELLRGTASTTINIFYSMGKTFSMESAVLNFAINMNYDNIDFADFNGDGNEDMLLYHSSVDSWYSNGLCTNAPEIIFFNRGARSKRLAEVVNGFNAKVKFEYSPLSKGGNFYSQTQIVSDPQLTGINGPVYVVSKVLEPDGTGGYLSTNYFYRDAIVHKYGKGFLGFLKSWSEKPELNLKSESTFNINTDYFLLTPDDFSKSNLTTGIALELKTYDFDVLPGAGSFGYKIQMAGETTYDPVSGLNEVNQFSFDGLGNIIHSIRNIANSLEVIETTSTYSQVIPTQLQSKTVVRTRNGLAALINTSYTYNTQGMMLTETIFPGAQASIETAYSYNNSGALVSKSLKAPNASPAIPDRNWSYNYDKYNRFIISETNPLNQESRSRFDPKSGQAVWQRSIDGQTVQTYYDGFGRVKRGITSGGAEVIRKIEWVGSGEMPVKDPLSINGLALYSVSTLKDGSPPKKSYFDSFGRVLENESVTINGLSIFSQKKYDTQGNISKETGSYFTTGGLDILLTEYFYHEDQGKPNKLWKIETTDGLTTNATELGYAYPGNGSVKIITTPPDGKFTEKTMDATGKLSATSDNDNGNILYFYHPNGKIKEISLDGVVINSVAYDAYGHQTSLTERNIGTLNFAYDAFNQLVGTTDANGNHYDMEYDVLGRLTKKTGNLETYTYTYIQNGSGLNRILRESVSVQGGEEYSAEYAYDATGRTTMYSKNIDGQVFSTSYQYNPQGQLAKTIYPEGFSTSNEYTLGILSGIKHDGISVWENDEVNSLGQCAKYTLGNGVQTAINFDNFGFTKDITSGAIQNLHMNFDQSNGNLLSRSDNFKNLSETYTYDNLNRLTTVNGPVPVSINYSSDGTIEQKSDAGSYSGYSGQHFDAVTELTDFEPCISLSSQAMQYTPFNKTKKIEEDGHELTIAYGPDQQRVKTELTHQGIPVYTKYYHPGFEKVISDGHVYGVNYISSPTGLAAMYVTTDGTNGKFYYVYKDHLGSILKLVEDNGIAMEQSFDAWGRHRDPDTWLEAGSQLALPAWLQRGFTGHEHLKEFSLINMNGRCYDPMIGMMLSPDKYVQDVSKRTSFNRYSYCMNNPTSFVDPSGNKWWQWLLADILTGGLISQTAVYTASALAPIATDQGYEAQKYVSPIAVKLNFHSGSIQNGIGFDVSMGMLKGSSGYRYNFGYTYYSSSYGGYTGWEKREGGEWEIIGGLNYSATRFNAGEFTQTTNMWTLGTPLNNIKFENDMDMNPGLPGTPEVENGDRYRTGAMQVNAGAVSLGFNCFTGDPGLVRTRTDDENNYMKNVYGADPDKYRAGVLYMGVGPVKAGINSEHVRAVIQNEIIHDNLVKVFSGHTSPHFRELDIPDSPYFYVGSGTGNTLY